MSDTVIKVENLSKKYILRHQQQERYTALRDVITNKIQDIGRKVMDLARLNGSETSQPDFEEFYALRDVSLEIKLGDRVGIIGRNGAGKSTLLKILSRITEPTTGRIEITGRVASLLEVGTGFHPELSGRENIFLNGAILGMSRMEIRKKFDEIVAFAEVTKFLDTPVKRYSSGMYVRLAFAVAAHLDPEILIVDEVLSVGDIQFQKRCLGKMEDVGKEGRTVIFVSHNMVALKSLCEKAIWLKSGSVVENERSDSVVSHYLQNGVSLKMHQDWSSPESSPGNNKVRLHSVKITYEGESSGKILTVASPVKWEFKIWNFEHNSLLNFSAHLYNDQNICIFNTVSTATIYPQGVIEGICHIPGNFLKEGQYRIQLLIIKDVNKVLIDFDTVAFFEVHDIERDISWYGKWAGVVHPILQWETIATSD